jgi:hypothetical protein
MIGLKLETTEAFSALDTCGGEDDFQPSSIQ